MLARSLLAGLLAATLGHAEEEPYGFWQSREKAFSDLVFARDPGNHLPLAVSLSPESFVLPSYVGGKSGGEGICVLGFLLSADLNGDPRVRPLLRSALRWSSPEGIPGNNIGAKATRSYWYELFPAILLTQLALRHPESVEMDANLTRMAGRYARIVTALGGAHADFNQTGFVTYGPSQGPVTNGRWTEPDASAAMAYVCYAAWLRHGEPAHLKAARWAMDALDRRSPSEGNPLYEICLYCAPALAARMNREVGTRYDVAKLAAWCLDTNAATNSVRPRWGRLDRDFGGVAATGLCGSTRDGDGYAFAMNTFVAASMLAPLAAEKPEMAPEIGRWLSQISRSGRNFFANEVDAQHQSAPEHRGTPLAAVPYEGLRERKRLSAKTQEASPGSWSAMLPAAGEIRWQAIMPAAENKALRLRVLDAERLEIFVGNYQLRPGQTSLGGRLPVAHGGIRFEFSIGGAPARLTKLRVECHPASGPWLTGDQLFHDWGGQTDLAVYGGAHIGSFSALILPSEDPRIQGFDLAATDHLGHGKLPRRLLVNCSDEMVDLEGQAIPAHGVTLR